MFNESAISHGHIVVSRKHGRHDGVLDVVVADHLPKRPAHDGDCKILRQGADLSPQVLVVPHSNALPKISAELVALPLADKPCKKPTGEVRVLSIKHEYWFVLCNGQPVRAVHLCGFFQPVALEPTLFEPLFQRVCPGGPLDEQGIQFRVHKR